MKRITVTLVALASVLSSSCGPDEKQTLTIVSWGGRYQDVQDSLFFRPFAEESGVEVKQDEYNGDYGLIERMVRDNSVSWDVVQVEDLFLASGKRTGLLEQIGFRPPGYSSIAVDTFGVASIAWAYVMAYNASFPDAPQTWEDFWDVQRFPGRRSLWGEPQMNLEVALLADGVHSDSLYPLDVERALRKLDQIKHLVYWWTSGDDLEQKLRSGDFGMIGAWSGRAVGVAREASTPRMRFTYAQGIRSHDFWIIPRGAPNADAARQFIRYHAGSTSGQVGFFESMGYGPPNDSALAALQSSGNNDLLRLLPNGATANLQIPFNADWWARNGEAVRQRWREWKTR